MTPVPGHRSVKMSAYEPRLNYSCAGYVTPPKGAREECLTEGIEEAHSRNPTNTSRDNFSSNENGFSKFQHCFGRIEQLSNSNDESISILQDEMTCDFLKSLPESITQSDKIKSSSLSCFDFSSSCQKHDKLCTSPIHNSDNLLCHGQNSIKITGGISSNLNMSESTNAHLGPSSEFILADNLLESNSFQKVFDELSTWERVSLNRPRILSF